ncbi:nuclear transport factor 2 family protein [Neolewinella antarctica]|uniref:SnoaL-like aldol condensation-catalyzing enzyme n=1 Tax=Neolewinella antarctica TaxID=442734 RepID=A0ABX0X8M1_9BACT|nr:nuclear transport factor 2 family protein [Neolewinella antarctica]NJC25606.1 putative SnoaL-like aldol condensation-catalyzing enzyme [Neolewinella antarctica]
MRLMNYALIVGIILFSINSYAQKMPNSDMTNQEIVKKFLNGFNNPAEIQESLDLLTADYKFKNPMVKLNSKTEFIELAKQIGAVITAIEIINIAENGNWVAVFYNFKSSVEGLESNTATEWFRVENGRIKESNLIYDASEWRNFYAKIEK